MISTNHLAKIGQLVGDPARAAMITALMDGRALTANELAHCANITPQTASSHLAQLTEAEILKVEKQGRHRYHRLASPDIAHMIEGMMDVALLTDKTVHKISTGPRDAAMRAARVCYDHFAGRLGVAVTDALVKKGAIEFDDEAGLITPKGTKLFSKLDIDVTSNSKRSKRPICRPCLDWSERRPHVAGKLGAAICTHFLEKSFVRRVNDSRALIVTPKGHQALYDMFGVRHP